MSASRACKQDMKHGVMHDLIQLYLVQLRTALAERLQYRGSVVIFALSLVIEPIVYLAIWLRVAADSNGTVNGFGGSEFAAYFITMMIIRQATYTWVMWSLEAWVRHGSLSPFLLRPVHPIHTPIIANLSMKLVAMVVVLPAALLLGLIFRPTFQLHPWTFLLFPPALMLSIALRFMTEWTIGLSCFWTTRIGAINTIYYAFLLFFSGQFAPVSLLPQPFAEVASWLPFYGMLGFPIELVTGRLSLSESLIGIGAQCGWLAVMVLVTKWIWMRGLRAYSAVGA